jgi:hypothetical protein
VISGGWILLIVLGAAVLMFVGILVSLRFTADAKLQRQVRKMPHRPIGELGDRQLGRIVGTAHPHGADVLTAPLSGRTCVYFIARLEERSGERWREVVREEKGVPFELRDESGLALIEPTAARISLEEDDFSQSGQVVEDELDPRQQAFLERHQRGDRGRRHYRYFEGVIAEGERVAVYGFGVREATHLRMTSSKVHPLLISDHASTTDV